MNSAKISIVTAVVFVTTLVGATFWLSNALNEINMRLASIESQLVDQWTVQDMVIWTLEFQQKNGALSVPDPRSTLGP